MDGGGVQSSFGVAWLRDLPSGVVQLQSRVSGMGKVKASEERRTRRTMRVGATATITVCK